MSDEHKPVIVVMGVAGSGKTTIGSALARAIGAQFHDADEFHSPENKAKMASGIPLTDGDRMPWLASMRAAIETWLAGSQPHVLACSALKHSYRDLLRNGSDCVHFVFLDAGRELVEQRLSARRHHFMKTNMVDSQFDTLEAPTPEEALIVTADQPVEEAISAIRSNLRL